jgi:competence protein ComEC
VPVRASSLAAVLAAALAAALALAHSGEVRGRAAAALGRGMPAREAELARGFVLGDDGGIDEGTVEDFRRAGLSHLVAVSGQNVALVVLLAIPLLALLGMPLRTRLIWLLGTIGVYVAVAGAGPSLLRAGVMGGLSVLATLAGRRTSRLYALAIAALVALAIDPAVAADVGWQLSFAAVLGIAFLAAPAARSIGSRLGTAGPLSRALAEGAAMTVAATVATAPLIAFHFGELSTVTLVANLLALPAVAPSMWLGMLAAACGQVPGFPVEAVNAPNALLLGYIAQVAGWCARPSWASLDVTLGPGGLAASYAGIVAALLTGRAAAHRRRVSRRRANEPADGRRAHRPGRISARRPWSMRRLGPAVALALVILAALALVLAGARRPPGSPAGLRVTVLDVGQGDAILLQPGAAPAILVDGGPPGDRLAATLRGAGVERLAAAVLTHDQSDHSGGIAEALGRLPVARLLYGGPAPRLIEEARAAGAVPRRVAAGDRLRSGRLRLDVIWPPPTLLGSPPNGEDPNRLALVMVARWGGFSMLLSADAEAEAVPIDPGPVDVLKVAHHGSEDGGLGDLLERTLPRLALISVGEHNPYGHPTAATLRTLASHGVRTLRTDRYGAIVLEVRSGRVTVHGG